MMFIAIFVGRTVINSYYIQLAHIVVLPILGFLISPVKEIKNQEDQKKKRILAGLLTFLLLLLDFFFISSNIITWSVIEVYVLSVYQILIIKYNHKL